MSRLKQDVADCFRECVRLRAEVERLTKELAGEEAAHMRTVDERDAVQDKADDLANAVGEYFGDDVGEHAGGFPGNCPWENALALLADASHAEIPQPHPAAQ